MIGYVMASKSMSQHQTYAITSHRVHKHVKNYKMYIKAYVINPLCHNVKKYV